MAGSTFVKINYQNSDLSRFQDNVDRALQPLQAMPMVGGNVLTNVSLTSAQDNLIQHGLDHTPQYFIVLKIVVNTVIWSPTSSSLSNKSADATYINLRCSTSCTATVWVN